MAFHGPSYGLDAELAAKRAAGYDQGLENDLRNWIEAVSGQSIGPNFQEGLKSGVILCNTINKVRAGSVAKVNTRTMPFMMMENLQNFLAGCRKLGVPDSDLFAVVDLYENKNMNMVLQGLLSLARVAQKQPGYRGPQMGARLATSGAVTHHEVGRADAVLPKQTAGSYGGANQSGMVDTSRNIVRGPAALEAARYGSAPAPAAGGAKFCGECGNKLLDGARFCPECGSKVA
eukprot:CAMPEP_0177647760 /NCGR_PEP_ID=MMETSP0447-20121125/10471_1 /TAXON_ID=0 /ORGANISM="Stygamoeba regulata, Strain BSH-02190019" /LENGTH=231 /DNA_ID=CAMNT_0019150365 /DNA_START=68 /DNA_END=763 /DNA_ORIENTATION=+